MRERWALFESPALGDEKFDVRSIDGVDELNQLFRFDVVLVRPGLVSAIDDVLPTLEKPASLWFEEDGKVFGEFHGIVAEAAVDVDEEGSFSLVRLQIVPRAWLLTQRRGDQIFLDRTIPEILVEKLEGIGLVREVDFTLALVARATRYVEVMPSFISCVVNARPTITGVAPAPDPEFMSFGKLVDIEHFLTGRGCVGLGCEWRAPPVLCRCRTLP